MKIYYDNTLFGIGIIISLEICVIRIGNYLIEIYNRSQDKFCL
jgi:hypothetical protein